MPLIPVSFDEITYAFIYCGSHERELLMQFAITTVENSLGSDVNGSLAD